MSGDNLVLKLVLQAKDGMTRVIRQAVRGTEADFDRLRGNLDRTAQGFKSFGKEAGIAGGALIGVSGVAAKLAGDFEERMNNVSTLIDTDAESLEDMSAKVLDIGKTSPKALGDLAEGLYNIRSAGISAEDQFNVLRGSEMLAVAGLASTSEAVDIATSALNAFQLKGEDASKMYDMFFKVVKYGKTNISEFAQGFGATAGVVASAGIKLDEYSAAVAAMTTTGVKANIAHTQMKAVIAGLTRSTDDQVEIFNRLGAKSFKDLISKSGGMVNALSAIKTAVGGNEAEIIALTGSVEAYNAVMSLTGATNEAYLNTLNDMRNGSYALSEGYNKQLAGFNNQMRVLKNNLHSAGITFGSALLPALKAGANILKGIASFIDRLPKGLVNITALAVMGAGTALVALSGLSFGISGAIRRFSGLLGAIRAVHNFIPVFKGGLTLIKSGLTGCIPAIKTAVAGMRTFNAACLMNPAVLVAAGIALAAVLLIKFWKPISGFFRGFISGLREGLAPIAPMFQGVAKAIGGVFGWIIKLVKPFELTGEASENLGKKIGKALGGAVTWCVQLIGKLKDIITLGGRIKFGGNDKEQPYGKMKAVDGSHALGLERVPFDGYTAELHKGEAVLSAPEAAAWRNMHSGANITINYAPKIEGAKGADKAEILKILKSHSSELLGMFEAALRRREVRYYG